MRTAFCPSPFSFQYLHGQLLESDKAHLLLCPVYIATPYFSEIVTHPTSGVTNACNDGNHTLCGIVESYKSLHSFVRQGSQKRAFKGHDDDIGWVSLRCFSQGLGNHLMTLQIDHVP